MINKKIELLQIGDIVKEDIYYNGTLLLKKNTELDKKKIQHLKKRNIKFIKVSKFNKEKLDKTINQKQVYAPNLDQFHFTTTAQSQQDQIDLLISKEKKVSFPTKRLYLTTIVKTLGTKHRYGKLLDHPKRLDILYNIYQDFCKQKELYSLFRILKSWDYYTYIHSHDVFMMGTILAYSYRLHKLTEIAVGYLLHDIGKIAISKPLLQSKEMYNHEQFEIMKEHTIKGDGILQSMQANHLVHYARNHHERLDGSGYPDQLTVDNIPLELRILQIIDVYSALTLDRPYKKAISKSSALNYLLTNNHLFDHEIVTNFINMLEISPQYHEYTVH